MATDEEKNSSNEANEPEVTDLFQDDVVLPSVRAVSGLEDYYALKETLAWTDATTNWPNIGETDWVVLYDSAILSSETPTVSIVKGDTTNLTIVSGTNLIFMDSTDLTINQVGGVSEIYFDPTKPAQIKLNITDGISALSHVSTQNIKLVETLNADGSRVIDTGAVSVNYETGNSGAIFVNDLILGEAKKAVPTHTLNQTPIVEEASSLVESEPKDLEQDRQLELAKPDIPFVNLPWVSNIPDFVIADVIGVRDLANEVPKTSSADTEALYDEDVLLEYQATDIVDAYLDLSPRENWHLSADNIFSSNSVYLRVTSLLQQPSEIAEIRFDELQEASSRQLDDLLVMQQWDDLLTDDLMDLFYGD